MVLFLFSKKCVMPGVFLFFVFYKKWANPASFSFYFKLFKHTLQFFTTNKYVRKCSSSIWCQDSNSRPLKHESPPITTRPGLIFIEFLCFDGFNNLIGCSKYLDNQNAPNQRDTSFRNFPYNIRHWSWCLEQIKHSIVALPWNCSAWLIQTCHVTGDIQSQSTFS